MTTRHPQTLPLHRAINNNRPIDGLDQGVGWSFSGEIGRLLRPRKLLMFWENRAILLTP